MIESELVEFVVNAGLLILVGLLIPATYRVIVGPSPADRVQAIDTITTLLIGIIILVALVDGQAFYVDLGIALAAFSFIGTLAIARFINEGRVF